MNEREILRGLAHRVAELAALPEQETKKELWYRHNALEETRPLIFCDPENGWSEIIRQEDLLCSDPLYRKWETRLRRTIFQGEYMKDDRVIDAAFDIGFLYARSDWGMHETIIGGGQGGSYRWDAPLKDYRELDRLLFPRITVDYAGTDRLIEIASDIFGDILAVRRKGNWWWTLGLTQTLAFLRGLEQIMYDMYDHTDELHALMAFLRDGQLAELDFLEKNDLLSLNNGNDYVGSGGFGFTRDLPKAGFDGCRVRTADIWGFAESQETSGVSPSLFEEFVFPYQKPILERFGLNCYGCCEPLNGRWDAVKRIPGLRRVSVSPWADIGDMAQKLSRDYIFSLKPNPAALARPTIDEDGIRRSLRVAIATTRDCRVEIVMKDNHTLGNNPYNAVTWCRIAKEESQNLRDKL